MKMYGTGASAYVYIGTQNTIYRVPVQFCSATNSSCVKVNDPYCELVGANESTSRSGDFNFVNTTLPTSGGNSTPVMGK